MTQLTFTTALQTDVGQQRSHNEDTGTVFELPGTQAAFLVCDGMGGLRAGDIASHEAARTVESVLRAEYAGGALSDPLPALRRALEQANEAINTLNHGPEGGGDLTGSDDDPTVRPGGASAATTIAPANALMGTTCVAGVIQDDALYLAHAGDSRAYLWRDGRLIRLTEDHSYVAERVRAGDITEAEARISRFRNVITRAIGIDATVVPDLRREPLRSGDGILICSDGLTTMLEDEQIAEQLGGPVLLRARPDRVASGLVDAANRAGGSDNITVLFVRVEGGGATERATTTTVTPIALATGAAPVAASSNTGNGQKTAGGAPRRAPE